MQKKIAIIGGGPAGISAALQFKRYNLEPLLFEPGRIGGLLCNAWRVENYPGFPEGISGIELAELFRSQLKTFGIDIRNEKVEFLDYNENNRRFKLQTINNSFSPEFVVVASGTKPKKLNLLEKLSDEYQQYIFYEVYPILSVEGKKVTIIGAGDAAFDYALNLSERNEVVIINRSQKISALPVLQDIVKKTDIITYHENTELLEVKMAQGKKLAITISNIKEQWIIETDFLVVAIGRKEQKEFYSEDFLKKEKALIEKGSLYLIGDVKNELYRQTSIGIGDGVRAAMQLSNIMKADRS